MHHSEIRMNQGIPQLYVDGKPLPLMSYQFMSSDEDITNNIPLPPFMPTDVQLSAMGSAGIRLYFMRIELKDPKDFDHAYGQLAKSIRQLRRNVPNSYAIPWLLLCPYANFYNKYPNEVQQFDDGTVGHYTDLASGRMADSETPRHTHASQAWRHETAGVLRRIVRAIRSEPDLDDAVIGYFFFPLQHEACYFYGYDHSVKLDDYSFPTHLAMRNYLAEKYMGRVDLLRKAWRDDEIDFEHIPLPDRAMRYTSTAGIFWDPAVSQPVIDYAEIRSQVWGDTLEYFARACKQEMDGHGIVGSFWGYLLHNDTLWGGQSFFRRMMDSPWLDFWASPFHYVNKNPGMSVTVRFLARSLQRHGKLFFSEVDTTTSTSHPTQRKRQGMIIDQPWQDGEILKREFTYTLTEGMHGWWIDWPSGTAQYDEKGLLPVMRRIQEIGRESLEKQSMTSVSEVAAVVHQESLFCVPNNLHPLTACAIESSRLYELPYLGAPVDHYELHDLLRDSGDYTVMLLQNCYMLSKEERADMLKLRRTGRTLIFQYATGFLSPDDPTACAENITDVTGICVRQQEGPQSSRIVLTEEAAKWGLTPGDEVGEYDKLIEGGMSFYRSGGVPLPITNQQLDPVFVVDDPEATVLGVYKENSLPALAVKKVHGCTLVYIGSPCVNTRVLRAFAQKAGVHLTTEYDCVVYENQSYLGLHACQDDPALTLKLRSHCALRELFSGKEYAAADQITIPVRRGETWLFEKK